jgi:hypothetical protein
MSTTEGAPRRAAASITARGALTRAARKARPTAATKAAAVTAPPTTRRIAATIPAVATPRVPREERHRVGGAAHGGSMGATTTARTATVRRPATAARSGAARRGAFRWQMRKNRRHVLVGREAKVAPAVRTAGKRRQRAGRAGDSRRLPFLFHMFTAFATRSAVAATLELLCPELAARCDTLCSAPTRHPPVVEALLRDAPMSRLSK